MQATRVLSKKAPQQFRMWMPQLPLTMVSARSATARQPAYAIFRTDPRMTKHEIKEYLTKIYDLPVKRVNTMNYEGKRKRVMGTARIAYYKYKDFKKAVVTFDDSLQDVGIGTRVPELEEEDDDDTDFGMYDQGDDDGMAIPASTTAQQSSAAAPK